MKLFYDCFIYPCSRFIIPVMPYALLYVEIKEQLYRPCQSCDCEVEVAKEERRSDIIRRQREMSLVALDICHALFLGVIFGRYFWALFLSLSPPSSTGFACLCFVLILHSQKEKE